MATDKLFKKAKAQHQAGLVDSEGSSPHIRREYFKVKDIESEKMHLVSMEKTPEGTLFSCDCTDQSLPHEKNLNKGRQNLCTHIISTIMWKYFHTQLPK